MSTWSIFILKHLLLTFLIHQTRGYFNAPNPAEHFCDFQLSLCGWFNSDRDDIDWIRHQGLTQTRQGGKILTGPKADHSIGNSTGFYLYMETSAHRSGQFADFISDIDYNTQGARLTFWYYMQGLSMGRLGILVWPISDQYPGKEAKLLWQVSGNKGDKWLKTDIDIPRQIQDYKIIIRAFVGGMGTSDIAIDDVTIAPPPKTTTPKPTTTPIPGSVKTLNKCDFQEDLCLWRNAPSGKIQWERQQGQTPTRAKNTSSTGPLNDHSLQTSQGYFIYMESSAHMQDDTADLLSPEFDRPVKLQFWYYMHGDNVGSLEVLVVSSDQKEKTLWSMQGEKGDKWKPGYANVPSDQAGVYKLLIRATVGKPGTSDIAIDDVTITQTVDVNSTKVSPSFQPSSGSPSGDAGTPGANTTWTRILFQCNFDLGSNCAWSRPEVEDMPWQFRSDATPTTGTGANRDHSSGKGRFAYIETSVQGRKHFTAHTKAVLTTPSLPVTLECPVVLTFWYNMYGATIGWLRIRVHNDSDPDPLWSRQHQQCSDGDTWKMARVPIPRTTTGSSFKLDIEATRGTNIFGDISIDDVVISQHCSDTGDRPGTEQEKVVFYCDFEDICDFVQSKADDFDWSLNHGPTATSGTGPDVDRTRRDNDGHYMYIETSGIAKPGISTSKNKGDKAILRSPVIHRSPAGCEYRLVLFYNMYGKQTGTLSVKITGESDALWSISGQQCEDGNTWKEAVIFLPTGVDQQFEIIGVRGNGYYGDIGIDDVSVELLCSDSTTRSVTQSTSTMKKSSSPASTSTSTQKTTTTISRTPATSTITTTTRSTTKSSPSTSTAATSTTTPSTTTTTPKTSTTTLSTSTITLSTSTTTPMTSTTTTTTSTTTPTTFTTTATTLTITPTISLTTPTTSTTPATSTTTTPTTSTTTTPTTSTTTTPTTSTTTTPTTSTRTTPTTSTTTTPTTSTTTTPATSTTTPTTSTTSPTTLTTIPTTTPMLTKKSSTTTAKTPSSLSTSTAKHTSSTTERFLSTSTPTTFSASTTLTSARSPSIKTIETSSTAIITQSSSGETSFGQSVTTISLSSLSSSVAVPNSVKTTSNAPTAKSTTKSTIDNRLQSRSTQMKTSYVTESHAGPLPGDDDILTTAKSGGGVQDNPSTRSSVLNQSQKDSNDSTPTIAGAAGGGAVMIVVLLGLFVVWRKKRRPSQKGRTIPVDDNLSYHSLDHGLEFDNVGYEQFIHTHVEQQSPERDSGLGNEDPSSLQPRFSDTGASVV